MNPHLRALKTDRFFLTAILALFLSPVMTHGSAAFLELLPDESLAKGTHIVLLSGDEEYRSEEAMPMLGAILAVRHGFRCSVLFALDPDGTINPDNTRSAA